MPEAAPLITATLFWTLSICSLQVRLRAYLDSRSRPHEPWPRRVECSAFPASPCLLSTVPTAPSILLLEGVHEAGERVLAQAGYAPISSGTMARSRSMLCVIVCAGSTYSDIRSRTRLDAQAFAAADRLIAVGCFCIGTNQVDLGAAARCGVPVFNAPFSNTRSVAELVLAEAVLLLRGVVPKHLGLPQ